MLQDYEQQFQHHCILFPGLVEMLSLLKVALVRVLIDTNILLDFLLQREPFFQDAELLFDALDSGLVVGYVTATTLTDIFYIAQKHTRSIEKARQAVAEILTVMIICPVDIPYARV